MGLIVNSELWEWVVSPHCLGSDQICTTLVCCWFGWLVGFWETRSYFVAQVGLELMAILLQPSECLRCRHKPPCLCS